MATFNALPRYPTAVTSIAASGVGGSNTYTVAAGKYAFLTITCQATGGTASGGINFNTVSVYSLNNNSAGSTVVINYWVPTGTVIDISTNNANSEVHVVISIFDIPT